MNKQNVVLIYSIYLDNYKRVTVGVNTFIEKKVLLCPLVSSKYCYKNNPNCHNICATLNKNDEYSLLWKGSLMFGRDKDKLLKAWEDAHRVRFEITENSFLETEGNLKNDIEAANNWEDLENYMRFRICCKTPF